MYTESTSIAKRGMRRPPLTCANQITGTRGPVIVSMCRHLHQHFTWMRLRIGMHLAERHRRQRTGSIAEAAQYRFRRILVDMRGTLAVIVSNGNGCGICG